MAPNTIMPTSPYALFTISPALLVFPLFQAVREAAARVKRTNAAVQDVVDHIPSALLGNDDHVFPSREGRVVREMYVHSPRPIPSREGSAHFKRLRTLKQTREIVAVDERRFVDDRRSRRRRFVGMRREIGRASCRE